ncbi:leucine-rich repeat protein [Tanacetum coccineum]
MVYEFMPNGSVHDWLHSSANTSKLNLLQRINILMDVAIALDYLHNRCQTTIVHGDLKPSNILLDADMVAHVGDFGLAQLLGTDLNQNSSSGVKGTIGYAPPDHVIDVIDNDAIVLQSTEANAKKVEECMAATILTDDSRWLNLALYLRNNVSSVRCEQLIMYCAQNVMVLS